ncbi:MAG: peptidylprolyl isomerase [Erysipelotrichaceae bacterium]|nr:peptidylprolyl isomerase [Erysipelotrichaceae bacterium]
MTDFLKKYWFVFLLAIIFLGVTVFYGYETSKNIVAGKKVNGQDIVYSLDQTNVSADELYEKLYDKYGMNILFAKIQKTVADKSIETTEEMKTNANLNAQNIISNFQQTYGATYETQILNALRQVGYTKIEDLPEFLIQSQKVNQIYQDYINSNSDEVNAVINKYVEENKPRLVSHILVKIADSTKPTAEELAKMEEVKKALDSGTSFEEVAKQYSEDTSASNGGSLGYVTSSTSFVPEFLEATLALNEGEMSDWVQTTYGYHLIKVDSTNLETLKTYKEFISDLNKYDGTLQPKAIWQKAEELGIDFGENQELESQLKEYLGLNK